MLPKTLILWEKHHSFFFYISAIIGQNGLLVSSMKILLVFKAIEKILEACSRDLDHSKGIKKSSFKVFKCH